MKVKSIKVKPAVKKSLTTIKKKKVDHKKQLKSDKLQSTIIDNETKSKGQILVKTPKGKKDNKSSALKLPKKSKTKKSHTEELEGLKDIDEEFYDFLKKNDKELLEFNLFDSEESDVESNENAAKKDYSDDEENEDEEKSNEMIHKPNDQLEVASDESDFASGDDDDAAEEAVNGNQKITLNLLRQWQMQLERPNVSVEIVRMVIQAFNSALASISGDDERQTTAFKVAGAAAFNGVVQLCVLHLHPAILRFLGLTTRSTLPLHKTKKWVKVRTCLRYYLTDLIRLVEQISSANILAVLLKHLHQMAAMVASFSTLGKTILKRLVVIWSTGDETVRVLAFLCILKITRNQQVSMLHHVLKAMYLSYVRNCKFVSPNTLPGINFMRRSLVEMFALDLNVSYQHVFLYIRQLAIHLRNAVILKKKDSFQSVYNWQYVNSLRLWADLLGATANKPQLQPLIYPFVTIATGVIRLVPTAQYFPLRFHCLQALISLIKDTQIFVPVMPLILEVLRSNTFNRKHTAVSMRPLQFTCILRLNKAQLAENGFRDEVIEQVCSLTLEYLSHESASLAFSDLVVPTIIAIKSYLKDCRNANHSRKLKQLLEKIQENSRFIDQERRKITFGLQDLTQVQSWETKVRNKGAPLSIYYASWVKTHETKKRRQAAQTDGINAGYDVPMIKRTNKSSNVVERNEHGDVELFPSESEDELPINEDEQLSEGNKSKKNKTKKQSKIKSSKTTVDEIEANVPLEAPDADDNVDIVKDLDIDDW